MSSLALTDAQALDRMGRVFCLRMLGPSERLVLLAVTASTAGGLAKELITVDHLSRWTALDAAEVQRALKTLEREGEVHVDARSIALRPHGSLV